MSVRRVRGRRRARRRGVSDDGTRRGQGGRKVGAIMRAAAFLAAQGGDGDHQADQRRIGCRAVAAGERQQAAMARARPCRSRSTPRPCDRIGRTAEDRRGRQAQGRSAASAAPRLASATLSATQRAQTTASSSELLASRLAPCSPVRPPRRRPTGRRRSCGRRRPPRCRPCDSARPAAPGSARWRDRCRPRQNAAMTGKRVAKSAPGCVRASRNTRGPRRGGARPRAPRRRAARARRRASAMKRCAGLVDQHGAFAAHRLADQRHRTRGPSSAVG